MFEELCHQLESEGFITLILRVRPGARETTIVGVMDDGTIKINVCAKAEEGKANAELIRFLAEEFNVPRGNIAILAGAGSRRKTVRITHERQHGLSPHSTSYSH